MPYVYDSFSQPNAINTDLIRPKKTGGTNAKVDCNLAAVGSCNISPGHLVVDGANEVSELLIRAPISNPTFTNTVTDNQIQMA